MYLCLHVCMDLNAELFVIIVNINLRLGGYTFLPLKKTYTLVYTLHINLHLYRNARETSNKPRASVCAFFPICHSLLYRYQLLHTSNPI